MMAPRLFLEIYLGKKEELCGPVPISGAINAIQKVIRKRQTRGTTENEAGSSRSMGVIVIELKKDRFITIIDMCGQEENETGFKKPVLKSNLKHFSYADS